MTDSQLLDIALEELTLTAWEVTAWQSFGLVVEWTADELTVYIP